MADAQKEDLPPPPYPDHQASSSDTAAPPQYGSGSSQFTTATATADEKRKSMPNKLHIYHENDLKTKNRRLWVTALGSDERLYDVTLSSLYSKAHMTVHRGVKTNGQVLAQVFFDEKDKEGKYMEITFPESGEKIRIEELGLENKKVPVKIEGKECWWRGTKEHEHEHKGKGKVGDAELVDGDGRVFAVFLNEWKAGGVEKESVGTLEFQGEDLSLEMVDKVTTSLLVLVERYQFMKGTVAKKAGDAAFLLLCTVS